MSTVESKACGKCGIDKPLSEFHKHPKNGLRPRCKTCRAQESKTRYEINRSEIREKQRLAYIAVAEDRRRKAREYYIEHAEQRKTYVSQWGRTNPDKRKDYRDKWAKENPLAIVAAIAARRAKKASATPSWANDFFIEEIYDIARVRSRVTGVAWQVDHIVPLRSALVCGLHVEHNLAVIPAAENRSKSNRYWPDMPSSFNNQPPWGGFFTP